jgi:hypothetical protein
VSSSPSAPGSPSPSAPHPLPIRSPSARHPLAIRAAHLRGESPTPSASPSAGDGWEAHLLKMDRAAVLRGGVGPELSRCQPEAFVHVFGFLMPLNYGALRCQCGGTIVSALWISSPNAPNVPTFMGGLEIPE